MCEAHVRVLCEIRNLLKEMQPTLARLRNRNYSKYSYGRHHLLKRHLHKADVEEMIRMCEELSNLLWFEGRDT